ncbi:hypothetical protein [Paracoccus saliphilus]|uniref:Uncharacterized protein n=1 Tax=Paracoccus saliphilus TaxID=405559 RepID=A0AA45W619_9RHOB|nr:hypothetical protein [Paracoccus saliphilus]WCR01648.1 hypothetical protein JHX88_11960 [Paracoccus saliphilus]SIS98357.1 hypothetical protein SAMN05421772_11123 [Paracoccus saliphilus]
MLQLSLDDRALQANLRRLSDRDARTAAVWALNDTADDVLKHVQGRMDQVFDRPTQFTKNAFMVWRAKPSLLEAKVMERPSVGRRHYLKVEEFGGKRGQTGLEALLSSRLGHDGKISAAVPAAGAKLNAYGNWSPSERNQALAAVSRQAPAAAATGGTRRRRRAGYFLPAASSRLSSGIWKRNPDGSIKKVLHFTTAVPEYRQRLGFFDGTEAVSARRLPVHLQRTIAKMVERAASRG